MRKWESRLVRVGMTAEEWERVGAVLDQVPGRSKADKLGRLLLVGAYVADDGLGEEAFGRVMEAASWLPGRTLTERLSTLLLLGATLVEEEGAKAALARLHE